MSVSLCACILYACMHVCHQLPLCLPPCPPSLPPSLPSMYNSAQCSAKKKCQAHENKCCNFGIPNSPTTLQVFVEFWIF